MSPKSNRKEKQVIVDRGDGSLFTFRYWKFKAQFDTLILKQVKC